MTHTFKRVLRIAFILGAPLLVVHEVFAADGGTLPLGSGYLDGRGSSFAIGPAQPRNPGPRRPVPAPPARLTREARGGYTPAVAVPPRGTHAVVRPDPASGGPS